MSLNIPGMPDFTGTDPQPHAFEAVVSKEFYAQIVRDGQNRRAVVDAARQQLDQASAAVRDLASDIEAFQATLNADEEVQVAVIGGPAATQIFLHNLTPLGADRIRYAGVKADGGEVIVVQHVTQMNVMLHAIRVRDHLPRRMTFAVVADQGD